MNINAFEPFHLRDIWEFLELVETQILQGKDVRTGSSLERSRNKAIQRRDTVRFIESIFRREITACGSVLGFTCDREKRGARVRQHHAPGCVTRMRENAISTMFFSSGRLFLQSFGAT